MVIMVFYFYFIIGYTLSLGNEKPSACSETWLLEVTFTFLSH